MTEPPQEETHDLFAVRKAKLDAMLESGDDPFGANVEQSHTSTQAKALLPEDEEEGPEVSVAGRIVTFRLMGKATFLKVLDRDGQIQAYVRRDAIGDDAYADFKKQYGINFTILTDESIAFETFATEHRVERCLNPEDILRRCDVVSLHMNLTDANRRFINKQSLAMMKDGAILLNCSRGGLIDETAVAEACRNGKLWGYGADVLEIEPIRNPHPFQEIDNILITPHIASRTFQSVERQAIRATLNLVNYLNGNDDYIQANKG